MYNIHSHYENLFSYIKTKFKDPVLLYFYPFGSIKYENLEHLHCNGDGTSPIFLCYDQEPILESTDALFHQIRQHYNWYRPILVLNTDFYSLTKKNLFAKYNFIDVTYFFHIFAASDWYRGYRYSADIIDPKDRILKKKFITFNRLTGNSRAYRSIFVAELNQKNLIDQGYISYSDICPEYGHYDEQLNELSRHFSLSSIYIEEIKNSLDQIKFPLRIDFKDQQIKNGSQTLNAISEMMDSFLHVVTETCFWDERFHLTEKIFKPIIAKQPFVLLGCVNNLKYLRNYGFKTFDAYWDESYDSIEDPIQRLQAVVSIIEKISKMSLSDLELLLNDMQDILEYNFNLFYSQEFVKNNWEILKNLLQEKVPETSDWVSTFGDFDPYMRLT